MKRLCLAIMAALMVGVLSLPAQEKVPLIVFDGQTKNFGKVYEGEILKHVFKFSNKGTATLEILKVEPS